MATSIEDLYQQYAGRASDPEGLAYWNERFGDAIDPNEISIFENSVAAARAQGTEPAAQPALTASQIANTSGMGSQGIGVNTANVAPNFSTAVGSDQTVALGALSATAPAVTFTPGLANQTMEQKAAEYNSLVNSGFTDAQIKAAADSVFGVQSADDWSYLQQIATGLAGTAAYEAANPSATESINISSTSGAGDATAADTVATTPDNNYEQIVRDAYASIGRTGIGDEASNIDQAGFDGWVQSLQRGDSTPEAFQRNFQTAVADYLVRNPEDKYSTYVTDFLSDTKPAAVSGIVDLYREVLDREPDAAGLGNWYQQFGEEISPEERAAFEQSAQAELDSNIQSLYTEFMGDGRVAEQEGLDYWKDRFGPSIDADEREAFRQAAAAELSGQFGEGEQGLLDGFKYAKSLGVSNEGLRNTLGEDLYNQYQTQLTDFAVTNLTNIVADGQLTWQESQQIHNFGRDLGFTPDELATMTGQDKSVFELANTNYITGRDQIINGTLTGESVTSDADRVISSIALQNEYNFTDEELAEATGVDLDVIKSSLDPVRNFETDFTGIFNNTDTTTGEINTFIANARGNAAINKLYGDSLNDVETTIRGLEAKWEPYKTDAFQAETLSRQLNAQRDALGGQYYGGIFGDLDVSAAKLVNMGLDTINDLGQKDKFETTQATPVYTTADGRRVENFGNGFVIYQEAGDSGYYASVPADQVQTSYVKREFIAEGDGGYTQETPLTAEEQASLNDSGQYQKLVGQVVIDKDTGNELTGTDGVLLYQKSGGVFTSKKHYLTANFTDEGVPILTTRQEKTGLYGFVSEVGPMVLSIASFIPGPHQPFARLASAALALEQKNYVGAVLGALGAAGSLAGTELATLQAAEASGDIINASRMIDLQETLSNVKLASTAIQGVAALQADNISGVINAGLSAYSQLGGPALPSGVTTAVQLGNMGIALQNGQFDVALNSLGDLTGSHDAKIAGAAMTVIDAIQRAGDTGDYSGVISAGLGLADVVRAGPSAPADQGGITNRVVDDAISQGDASNLTEAGVSAYTAAKSAGATDAEAMDAANAVTGVVVTPIADSGPSNAVSTTLTPDTEFGDLDSAIADNAIDDAVRTDQLSVISNLPKFSDAYAQARDLLGANKTFTWNGKEYSTATAAERPDLNITSADLAIDALNAANLSTDTDASRTVGAQTDTTARIYGSAADESAAETTRLSNQNADLRSMENTSFLGQIYKDLNEQFRLQGVAANEYLANNPNSPITDNISTAFEAAGNLQKNVAGGVALLLDDKPLADALVAGGDRLTQLGQSIGTGPQDTKNWEDTVDLVSKASGFEKVAVIAGRILDGTSGLGRQVEIELRQELPGMFLGGGSVKGILLATGAMDTAETAGNAALDTYDEEIKKGASHEEALSSARTAGAVAGMTEAAVQLTLGKAADVIVGKIGNVAGKAGTKIAGEGVVEGGQEAGASVAVDLALGNAIDVNSALTQGVLGAAVGKGAATATSGVDAAQTDASTSGATTGATATDLGSVGATVPGAESVAGTDLGSIGTISTGSDAVVSGADTLAGAGATTVSVADAQTVMGDLGLTVSDATAVDLATKINNVTTQISTGADASVVAGTTVTGAITAGASADAAVGSTVTAAVTAGADAATVVGSSVTAAVTAGSNASTAVGSAVTAAVTAGSDASVAVGAAVTAAVNAGANVDASVASSVSAAVTSGSNVTAAVDAAVTAATNAGNNVTVASDANTTTINNSTTNTSTTVNTTTGVTTTVDSNNNLTTTVDGNTTTAVDANNNTTTQTVVDGNTTTTVTADANVNTKTQTVVDGKTTISTTVDANNNTTTQTTTDANNNIQTTVLTDVNANTQTTVKVNTETGDVIEVKETEVPTDWTQPVIDAPVVPSTVTPASVTPEKPAVPQVPKLNSLNKEKTGAGGVMGLPSDWSISGKSLGSRETQKAIDPLARVKQAQAELERDVMMNQIDPRLMNVMQQRMDPQQQSQQFDKDIGALAKLLSGESSSPAAGDNKYYSYGSEDSIDSILGGEARTYKDGGYVEPLKASGGSMALPLLAKSGGALGQYGGREDYKGGKHVAGEGDGQSDDIPAWLADGEFVFPADVVSALGNGSTKAGTDKLYTMMHGIRDRARSKGPKDLPPPALKSPLDYLKSSKRSTT